MSGKSEADRAERLAHQLRVNLRRRKAQARAMHGAGVGDGEGEGDGAALPGDHPGPPASREPG